MRYKILPVLLLALTGCADTQDISIHLIGDPYGFWFGLWHGVTAFFSFFGQLFSDDIAVYAINNTGGWYDFGFCLGIGVFSSGSTATVRR